MSPRVLIVTSSYKPTMIADMHRARHLAWELPKLGWTVEILAPDVVFQPSSCIDNDSAEFFAPGVSVHLVAPFRPRVFDAIGVGTIGWRALYPMLKAGRDLLSSRRFDIVYITTAQFPLFLLGPAWRRRFGVPFVLDFHDPCFKGGDFSATVKKFGFKFAVSELLSLHIESKSTAVASGLVSVSPIYIEQLRCRYPERKPQWLTDGRHSVIPFAALPHDVEEASKTAQAGTTVNSSTRRVVYIGAGGWIMLRSFSILCKALALLRSRQPQLVKNVRFDLFGTILGWRSGEAKALQQLAQEHGVGDLVNENPMRVTYRHSLELLLENDGALILGVDDASYIPSKLFSYALAGKPILASFRRDGPAYRKMQDCPWLGHALWFDNSHEISAEQGAAVTEAFLRDVLTKKVVDRRAALQPFLAAAMASQHAEMFETIVKDQCGSRNKTSANG